MASIPHALPVLRAVQLSDHPLLRHLSTHGKRAALVTMALLALALLDLALLALALLALALLDLALLDLALLDLALLALALLDLALLALALLALALLYCSTTHYGASCQTRFGYAACDCKVAFHLLVILKLR